MNALDRKVAAMIAEYLHEQDPRFVWEPHPATGEGPMPQTGVDVDDERSA